MNVALVILLFRRRISLTVVSIVSSVVSRSFIIRILSFGLMVLTWIFS